MTLSVWNIVGLVFLLIALAVVSKGGLVKAARAKFSSSWLWGGLIVIVAITAATIFLGEEELNENYNLAKGTPLYEEKENGKFEKLGILKVDVAVRILPDVVEGENQVKFRKVLFPVIINEEFAFGVFDHRSHARFVALSDLGDAGRSDIKSNPLVWYIAGGLLCLGLVFLMFSKGNKTTDFLRKSLIVMVVVVLGIGALYYLIVLPFYEGVLKDHGARIVAVDPVSAAQAGVGEEVRIELVPGIFAQGGHIDKIFLPKCKFRRVIITETLVVRKTNGDKAPLVLHFGAKNLGTAKIPMPNGNKHVAKGAFVAPLGARNFVPLTEGTEIEFNFADDTMIWFSFADRGKGELEFAHSKVVFAYRELKM